MKIAKLGALLGLVSSLLANGCASNATDAASKADKIIDAPYASDADNQRTDDQALKHKLQDTLDAQLKGSDIRVCVNGSNVLLLGQTLSADTKNQAETLAKSLPNVKKVFNYLTINMQPSLNTSSSISSQALDRIGMQKGIYSQSLQITTVDGVVYIMGSNVGNLTALETAIQGVYSIERVNKVVNLVQKGDQDYYTR